MSRVVHWLRGFYGRRVGSKIGQSLSMTYVGLESVALLQLRKQNGKHFDLSVALKETLYALQCSDGS